MKKYLVIFIVITLHLSSCSDTNIRYDYCVSVVQNNIVISTNNPSKSVITIQRELSPSGRRVYISNGVVIKFSIRDSVTLEVRNKDSINILNLLMRSHNKMNIACEFAKLNKIAWRISNSSIDTVIYTTHFHKKQDIELFANIKSGIAAKLSNNTKNNIKEIKNYLYDQKIEFSDSLIKSMNNVLAQLDNSEYTEFTTEEEIPIIKSFAGIKYSISSDLKADYYYLFATNK